MKEKRKRGSQKTMAYDRGIDRGGIANHTRCLENHVWRHQGESQKKDVNVIIIYRTRQYTNEAFQAALTLFVFMWR